MYLVSKCKQYKHCKADMYPPSHGEWLRWNPWTSISATTLLSCSIVSPCIGVCWSVLAWKIGTFNSQALETSSQQYRKIQNDKQDFTSLLYKSIFWYFDWNAVLIGINYGFTALPELLNCHSRIRSNFQPLEKSCSSVRGKNLWSYSKEVWQDFQAATDKMNLNCEL